MEHHF
jgi:hypothetical protein